ncbi:uncharacterized protein LOC101860521 [Aplysia californica]|uniref:Uncharacterized protein LOC101860521 n=1 Tax=Aplysia californica TaxID=6500 RepID=A0ABM1VZ80_APLCA|nr:uncharacterized protein LOC101860521 [Aplysia californica]XP_035827723.1 uncharacterized protein LOC101860521 [Aplysia californica]
MSGFNGDVDCDIASAIFKEFQAKSLHAFCDFTVIVEGQKFKCHRFIMGACSEFFNGLLRSGMRESLEQTVTIQGISKESFSLLLHCLYSGSNVFTPENVIALWHAINMLQITCLKQKCEDFVIGIMGRNYVDLYRHAKLLDCDRVLNVCLDLMRENFETVSKMESVVYVDPKDFLYLISHNHLIVSSEDLVVYAILKWVSKQDHCSSPDDFGESVSTSHLSDLDSNTDITDVCQNVFDKGATAGISTFKESEEDGLDISSDDATPCATVDIHIVSQESRDGLKKDAVKEKIHSSAFLNPNVRSQLQDKDTCGVALSESPLRSIGKDYASSTLGHMFSSAERKSWLSRLLGAAKLCLVSTVCIEVLMGNQAVLESHDTLQMVREAVVYQLKPSHSLTYWPESAIHRLSSKLENVAVFLHTKDAYLMAYSFERAEVFYMSRPPCSQTSSGWFGQENLDPHSLCVFDDRIFLAKANKVQRGFSFPFSRESRDTYAVLDILCTLTSPHNWAPVMSQVERVQVVLGHGKQLYLIGSSIYRITPGESLTLSSATKVKALASILHTPSLAYGFRNNILIFGQCQDAERVRVTLFDPESLELRDCPEVEGPADHLVAFNTETDDFLLQRNGSLWQIDQDCDRLSVPKFRFVTKLWGFDWNLRGAIVYKKSLYLFGNNKPQPMETGAPGSTGMWSSSLPGIFDSIKVVPVPAATQCLPVVLPRDWLVINVASMQHVMSI